MNARMRYRRRTPAALVILALVSTFGAACSADDTGSPEPSPPAETSTPEPTVDPSVADAEQQALAAYRGYVQAYATARQTANPDDANLARYLADPLLGQTRHAVRKLKNIGAVQVGAQQATVVETKTDLAAIQPKVTIYSCLDYSQIKLVYKSNRSPVPDSEVADTKVPAVSTVWLYANGKWLVNDTKEGSHTC